MPNGAEIYEESWERGWAPDPDFTVSEWADKYRMLSQKAASEPGEWRTSRTPYLREIMDNLSPSSPVEEVVFIKGAQVGGTESGNNWVGYVIHHAPGPMMYVQPTVETAKRLSKQRLTPMIDETPVLRERIAPQRERDSGNTMLQKDFAGGVLILTGANSAVGLRSMPVRYLFLDEIDGYPSDAEGEGDPVALAEKRTATFGRRKIFKVSTPTVKGESRIERAYNNSDKRRYYVQCPHCKEHQWLKWGGKDTPYGIKWDENAEKVWYVCEHHGCVIEEHHKTEMLKEKGYGGTAEWRATEPSDGRVAGYHLSSLYSPLGWKSWADCVREHLQAVGDPRLLKTWVNTVLGETWEEDYSAKLAADEIEKRAEPYELGTVPEGGLIVCVGIDVQDNRVAVVQRAFGRDEQSWLVNWFEVFGDPQRPELWAQIDNVLDSPIRHESSGTLLYPMAAAIDTGGHHTHAVYLWARKRVDMFNKGRTRCRVAAVHGSSLSGKPIIGKPSKQDINWRNQVIKKGVDLWPVGTDTAKATIFGRLKNQEPGPGTYHFPVGVSPAYYEQLTAEKQKTIYVNGYPKRRWVKAENARNEALDCEVYALAALQFFKTRVNPATMWDQLAARIEAGRQGAASIPASNGTSGRRIRSPGVSSGGG